MSDSVKVEFDVKGMTKMIKALEAMQVDVQPAIDKAARKGIQPVKKAIKAAAPVAPKNGGTLQAAIRQKKERTKYQGKRVYEVTFTGGANRNSKLQRAIKRPGIYGGKSDHAYYPASQEYGFLTRAKDGRNVVYTYGRRMGKKRQAEWHEAFDGDSNRYLRQVKSNSFQERVFGVKNRKVEGQHYMAKGAE